MRPDTNDTMFNDVAGPEHKPGPWPKIEQPSAKKESIWYLVVGIVLVAVIGTLAWRTLGPSEIIMGAAHQQAQQGK